ncbi:hypothetical protein HD593_011557 [Nonomuraea rubra]|uniref:Uncharacterized protein n=1 Tax=Nonomuraea rubra TaxID=46180 RepID=A0A7X0P803_9ACTN|nr:hypothetical protein [Nonomuraea rubra]
MTGSYVATEAMTGEGDTTGHVCFRCGGDDR